MKKIQLCAFSDEAASDLDGQIAALKANHIYLTELRSVDGVNVKDISLERAREIQAALGKNGLAVYCIGSPIGKIKITDDFESEKQRLRHILRLCKIFGCAKVRMFSFFTDDYENDRAEVLRRLGELTEIAEKENILLCHENEKDIYGDRAERVLQLLAALPRLKSVFDPANFIQVGEDMGFAIDKALPLASHVHIKDVDAKTDELVPAGEGDCRIADILQRLSDETVLTLEPHLKLFDGYASIDSTVMKNRFTFSTCREAFDCACDALKKCLRAAGYAEAGNQWVKK